jgi:hypothetical protein
MEGSESESVQINYGSGCGSRRSKTSGSGTLYSATWRIFINVKVRTVEEILGRSHPYNLIIIIINK